MNAEFTYFGESKMKQNDNLPSEIGNANVAVAAKAGTPSKQRGAQAQLLSIIRSLAYNFRQSHVRDWRQRSR
jgi:hypothetical protein